MLRLVSAAILASIAAFALVGGAEAKGPFRLVISGGDLVSPITLDHVDDGAMYGNGFHMEPPLPYPEHVYSLTFYPDGADADAAPDGTISYYPAHDGLPAAFRTSYGFFVVMPEFEALMTSLLPSHETDGGTSPLWYAVPALALGLVLAGGLTARAVRRGATPSAA